MDKTALRMAESNLLRAEAAIERHHAKAAPDRFNDDPELNTLYAAMHNAKADLLETQADWVLHSEPEEG